MRLTTPTGEYIRESSNTDAEARWMRDVLSDFPTGPWALSRCISVLDKSARNFHPRMLSQNPIPPFNGAVLVYCLADDTPIGVTVISYIVAGPTGWDNHYLAIHRDYRGQGHFTKFSDALYWLADTKNVDSGRHFALETAPQVRTRAAARGATEGKRERSEFADADKVEIISTRATLAATLSEADRRDHSLETQSRGP